jgi:hypothetical protein
MAIGLSPALIGQIDPPHTLRAGLLARDSATI